MPYEVERRRGLMWFVKRTLLALVPLAALTGAALAQDDRFPNLLGVITVRCRSRPRATNGAASPVRRAIG
jgi:hypothetical protein